MSFSVDLSGDEELRRLLAETDQQLDGRLTRRMLWAASKPIEMEAKRLAPERSGLLRSQIGWKRKGTALHLHLGKAYYGWFVERGTPRMAARPFLRPAFDAKKEAGVQAARRLLEEWIASHD
jgi:HK97 gp10 family phage protein